MDQSEYLKDRLEEQIDWYDKKSIVNQKWFKRLQVLVIVASSTIPFIAGYIDEGTESLKFIVGILGLFIAAITAILGLYKFQEHWIEYRTTCESLRHEKFLFLTSTEPYDGVDSFKLLVERVEGLISKENSQWGNYTKNHSDKHS